MTEKPLFPGSKVHRKNQLIVWPVGQVSALDHSFLSVKSALLVLCFMCVKFVYGSILLYLLKLVTRLVEAGEEVNTQGADGMTPLAISSFWGYSDIVNCLLRNGYVLP